MIGQRRPGLSPRQEREAYAAVTVRDGNRCVRCRRFGSVQRDHRQNRDRFNTVVEGLQLLCLECHKFKTEHPAEAIREGWGMPRNTLLTPAEWPARRYLSTDHGTFGLAWVTYTPDGFWREITSEEAERRMTGLVV